MKQAKKPAAKKDNPEKRFRIEHLFRAAKLMNEIGIEVKNCSPVLGKLLP